MFSNLVFLIKPVNIVVFERQKKASMHLIQQNLLPRRICDRDFAIH